MLSTSILSRPIGPRELFTTFAIVWAARTTVCLGVQCMTSQVRSLLRTVLIAHILSRYTISAQESSSMRIALEHFEDKQRGGGMEGRLRLRYFSGRHAPSVSPNLASVLNWSCHGIASHWVMMQYGLVSGYDNVHRMNWHAITELSLSSVTTIELVC